MVFFWIITPSMVFERTPIGLEIQGVTAVGDVSKYVIKCASILNGVIYNNTFLLAMGMFFDLL